MPTLWAMWAGHCVLKSLQQPCHPSDRFEAKSLKPFPAGGSCPATTTLRPCPAQPAGPPFRQPLWDANPFIIAYNATTNKYHSPYYVAHVRPPFLCSMSPCSVLSSLHSIPI